jgi:NAD(P)-dependent dehydrogenase (short-subunit alcohol dehydrogenase family)
MTDRDRWVMVTGGTGGIGKALIARLAASGHNVIATARRPQRLSTVVGPGRVAGVQLDLEDSESIEAAVREVAGIVGRV